MHQSQPVSLLCLISELGKRQKVTAILEKHEALFTLVSYGKGTASKKILNYLGLGETGKIIFIKLLPGAKAKELMNALDEGLQLDTPSHGIAFIADVDQVCFHRHIDCAGQTDGGSSTMPNESPYHLIFAVLNRGYAEEVMAAARAGGATGGTALQDATELVVTLPLLLALVHWIAPSVRALSHSSLKLQLQFGVDGSAGFYRIEKSGTLLRLKAE